jgi:diacylglycerol kinase (ATP)
MGKVLVSSSAFEHAEKHATLSGRDRNFLASRWYSFNAALAGVWYILRTQPNAWIELAASALVVLGGLWLSIQTWEWALLLATIFGVLALEALNTAIESVVDLVSPDYHPMAKIAKDSAAAAMVFAVFGSLCVAATIFGPRLWSLLT